MIDRQGQLKNPPLYFVLTSIRFQTLAQLPKWIPAVQDRLRDRFPLFSRLSQALGLQGMVINIGAPPTVDADAEGIHGWTFLSADRAKGCHLFNNNLILYTRTYKTYEAFRDDIAFALDALFDSARHIDVEYIGIRYLDSIKAKQGLRLDDYVPSEFLPWQSEWTKGVRVLGSNSLSSYAIGADRVNARFKTAGGQLRIPEDLIGLYITSLDLSKPMSNPPIEVLSENEGMLDTDSFWASSPSERLGKDEIVTTINRLHGHANEFFRIACKEQAFRDWQAIGGHV